jgi:ATP-dependent helicase/nuclease subunit A
LSQLTEKPSEHAVPHLLGESIHTEANDAAQQLGLPFDTMGPDEIGSVIHDTLTELISQGVSEAELTGRDDIVTQAFDDIVSGAAPALDDADRDKLWEFFTDILDDFMDSELWSLIQAAESVRVEKAIDGLVTTDTVEVELHGQVDIVIDFPSGKQVVSDLKIALADPTQATQRRYNLQVASYAFLFGQQRQTSESVQPMIATFGVNTKTMTISGGARLVKRAIRNLVD